MRCLGVALFVLFLAPLADAAAPQANWKIEDILPAAEKDGSPGLGWEDNFANYALCEAAWRKLYPDDRKVFSLFDGKKPPSDAENTWGNYRLVNGNSTRLFPVRFIPAKVKLFFLRKSKGVYLRSRKTIQCYFPSAWKLSSAATNIVFDPKLKQMEGCTKKSEFEPSGLSDGYKSIGGMLKRFREKFLFKPPFYSEFYLLWSFQSPEPTALIKLARKVYGFSEKIPIELSHEAFPIHGPHPVTMAIAFRETSQPKAAFWALHVSDAAADPAHRPMGLASSTPALNENKSGTCDYFKTAIQSLGFVPLKHLDAWNWELTCQLALPDCWGHFGWGEYRQTHWSFEMATDLYLEALWKRTLENNRSLTVMVLWLGEEKRRVLLTEATILPSGELEKTVTRVITTKDLKEMGLSPIPLQRYFDAAQ